MGREYYTNAVPSTLNGGINNSTTTVVVTDANAWPAKNFNVVCESEIMYCTLRSGNTLTVRRGQEGTTGVSHSNAAAICNIITAGTLNGLRRNYLADLGLVPIDDSLSADDDEFDDESFTGWTYVSDPAIPAVATERNHRLSVYVPGGGGSSRWTAYLKAKTPSAGDWIQAGFQSVRAVGYHNCGIMMANGATFGSGSQVVLSHAVPEFRTFMRRYANFNSWDTSQSNDFNGAGSRYLQSQIHLRLVWLSANTYKCMESLDGISWCTLTDSYSIGNVGTVTHMGPAFTTWGSSDMASSVLYCRFSF